MRTALAIVALTLIATADEGALPAVADAISMTRIQFEVTADGRVAAVSPDGSRIAFAVWRGDLERNVNVYSLCVLEPGAVARPVALADLTCPVTADFAGDRVHHTASPFAQVSFVADGRALAFLGRLGAGPAQVYTANIATGQVTQLTHHPTDVRSFVVDASGRLRLFSAVTVDEADRERVRQAEEDGLFVFDRSVHPEHARYRSGMVAVDPLAPRRVRQYFWLPPGEAAAPRLILDSRHSHTRNGAQTRYEPGATLDSDATLTVVSSLSSDRSGRYALLYPYARADHDMQPASYRALRDMNPYAHRLSQPYGVVDLTTGAVAALLDAPHFPFVAAAGSPVWSPDGQSVLVYVLSSDERDESPRWTEVDLATRRHARLPMPDDWRVVSWTRDGVLATRADAVGRLRRTAKGWMPFEEIGETSGFAGMHPATYQATATARHIVGIKQGLSMPPELAAYDLTSKETHTLTDLNPALKKLRLGKVEDIRWTYKHVNDSSGLLIKPIGYQPDRRYPLVVQLDDGVLGSKGQAYVLDSPVQLSGYPTQMLAAEGIAVLYMRTPDSVRRVMETAVEPEIMRGHIEAGIVHLDLLGIVDPDRVGIAGWSRAAYHVMRIMTRSQYPYAAASIIDGGQNEYLEGFRPYWDGELARLRAPLLLQPHGPRTLVSHAHLADRLDALGKSVEILYFATAPHSTVLPRHRRRSLEAHLDWWRFWLQGRRDADARKNAQYERWAALRPRRP